MKEQLVKFETAKLAKEKEFDLETLRFYTKPNSKMFGLDEKGRSYSIKNTPKKLYKCGEHAALNIQSVYPAPTQSLLQRWLRETHNLHIALNIGLPHKNTIMFYSNVIIFGTVTHKSKFKSNFYKTYEEALEIGLQEALKLIK